MPIYEYQCESCDHKLEALQKISDDKLLECPECHQKALKKLISAAGFRLKGGGWYETDFKSGSRKNVVDSGESGEKKSTSDEKKSTSDAKKSNSDAKKPTTSSTKSSEKVSTKT